MELTARLKTIQKSFDIEVKLYVQEKDTLTTDELNDLMFALADANTSNYDLQRELMEKYGK